MLWIRGPTFEEINPRLVYVTIQGLVKYSSVVEDVISSISLVVTAFYRVWEAF